MTLDLEAEVALLEPGAQPRNALAKAVRDHASAAMDVSAAVAVKPRCS